MPKQTAKTNHKSKKPPSSHHSRRTPSKRRKKRRAPILETRGNLQHKDRLFRKIFQDKKDLLSLYNAVNHSRYENPDDLEITTLEDVLYMGMKNDLSFLVDSILNLYEAQSTWNPNMPLRGLAYFSRMYSGYVASRDLDVYSRTRILLPNPRYLVFYNGTTAEPEQQVLRLSDSFIKKTEGEPCLECIATVININWGHNQELMEHCRKLWEYAFLVEQIRKGLAEGLTLEGAIDHGIAVCLQEGVLTEFLIKHQGEVKLMILTEYNEALHLKDTYHCGYQDGEAQGIKIGETRGESRGIKIGEARGESRGIKIGEARGESRGIKIGEARGEDRLNQLYQYLSSQNRMDDLKRALAEDDFRRELMEKYFSK